MVDELSYLTTNEAALAVVATAMKKARLQIDTLVVNSIMGGILFTAGGMLHVMVQSEMPDIYSTNPGVVQLLQGLVYPIGLFYVVVMGVDLFNSNILFFSVAVARGAVSFLDLIISWLVSWWFNLVGNIFVCYIICHFSHISSTQNFIDGSRAIVVQKAEYTFVQTLLKAMAGNFFVCLAIYLQLMAKPLHVKFLLMLLPIFTFVAMGFTHSVADMYLLTMGLINGAPVPFKEVVWKIFLPGAIGNIIGGSFFGLVVPWYLHIFVVERDQKLLNLPKYDLRDEQPELNQDSRVVRVKSQDEAENEDEDYFINPEKFPETLSSTSNLEQMPPPQGMADNSDTVSRVSSRGTGFSRFSSRTHRRISSPANVFPVYGMGPPLERERSIANGRTNDEDDMSVHTARTDFDQDSQRAAYLGDHLRRAFSRTNTQKTDPEALRSIPHRPGVSGRRLSKFSFHSKGSRSFKNNLEDLNARMDQAGITNRAAGASNEIAGIPSYSMAQRRIPSYLTKGQAVSPIEEQSACPTPRDNDSSSYQVVAYDPKSEDTSPSSDISNEDPKD